MRGRLIRPFTVTIARMDYAGTRAASKYSDTFREVKPGQSRSELPNLVLKAQIETEAFDQLQAFQNGNNLDRMVILVMHFKELEQKGLVDLTTGMPTISVNDRLVDIRRADGALVQVVRNPPGLYCVRSQPEPEGLGGHRNLLLTFWNERQAAASGA